jgi:hypothetical protein
VKQERKQKQNGKMVQVNKKKNHSATSGIIPIICLSFVLGCIVATTIVLNFAVNSTSSPSGSNVYDNNPIRDPTTGSGRRVVYVEDKKDGASSSSLRQQSTTNTNNPLQGMRVLIAIAAYDFSQIPHLEEVLDAYQDLCVSGVSKIDVIIHATIPYPVTLIDLLNNRLLPICRDVFRITIVLKSPNLRLHLVDCHRELFYNHLEDYDLFIYTEDDIRVTPKTVGAYLSETSRVQNLVGLERSSDFNVGIVRYEYNWPTNVIIDDKTRHATQNVTRVYWEHGRVRIIFKN